MPNKRNLNFALAWETQRKKNPSETSPRFQTKSLVMGVGGIFLIVVLTSSPWLWEYKLRLETSSVNKKITELHEIDQQVQKLNAMKEQAQNQKKLIDLIEKSTRDPGPVLDKLQKLLPQGTTVKSFSLQADNSVALSVTIPTPVDVARLWTSLRDSGVFLNVDIQTLSLQDKAQDFSFALKLK